ncbi:MAG: cytochrome c oxidase subunit 3 [Armatimonadota bacterium]|nr:cytochrome c oxidase subunit 3 [Armatimonadota bacterium]MDR5703545.1 cytochrome c oxidase subunit 3 [Armatimonadota bacterium]MDR7433551.1 cytochrome c oxidase subunit 3 [Armatimonadota bacterium]
MQTVRVHVPYDHTHTRRIGLWLFFISEGFLFLALISSRYYLFGLSRPEELNQALGLLITTILLLSSLTAYRAETSILHGDQGMFLRNTLATILLGSLFLVGVALEWAEAFRFFPPHTRFGTIFFTLTGMHGFHVLSGVVLLVFLYFHGRRGRFGVTNTWPVEGVIKYWHFVDVVWVFIYPTLYLVSS